MLCFSPTPIPRCSNNPPFQTCIFHRCTMEMERDIRSALPIMRSTMLMTGSKPNSIGLSAGKAQRHCIRVLVQSQNRNYVVPSLDTITNQQSTASLVFRQSQCVVLNSLFPVSVPLTPVYLFSDTRSATMPTSPWQPNFSRRLALSVILEPLTSIVPA